MPNLNFFYNSPMVRKLLGWKQGSDDEKWVEKAKEGLFKRLEKRKGDAENLRFALNNPGSPSPCVTIPRSLDGRLQVSHKKGLPHVFYCKLWRWPDLTSPHELKPIDSCKYSFNSKQKEVCINPYHYRRVDYSSRYVDCDTASLTSGYDPRQRTLSNNLHTNQLALSVNGNPSPTLSLSPNRPYSYDYFSSDSPSPDFVDEFRQRDFMEVNCVAPQPLRPSLLDRKKCWCSVSYYELNSRVGEFREICSPSFVVNGRSDSSDRDDRICLGLFTSVNRNSTIMNTRRSIGEGLCVRHGIHDGKRAIIIDCLSANPIFVQSRCFNYSAGRDLATVCKVIPGVPTASLIPVFIEDDFRRCIEENRAFGFQALYELHKMCSVRVSFAKGWGELYRRQDITSTPCWIEMSFFEPLKLLDSEIKKAETPVNAISSRS